MDEIMQPVPPGTSHRPDVISLLSPSGRLLYVSASAAEAFGYRLDEIIGGNPLDLVHPDDRLPSRHALKVAVTRPPGPSHVTLRVRRKDGGWCWVEGSFSSLRSAGNSGTVVVRCREILPGTVARNHVQAELGDSNRTDTRLEDFANAVAHDLREPLRTVAAYTELLVRDTKLDAEGQLRARLIVRGIARMAHLLQGLRAFGMSDDDQFSSVLNLETVVNDVLLDLSHAIRISDARVTVGPLPSIRGNKRHLQRILRNLIANAINYRGCDPVRIDVTAERLGTDWIIRTRDNGIGIASEHHEQIFAAFSRLHGSELPGTGIGLSICRQLVHAMGGEIWVESEPGLGSSFCFTIAAAGRDLADGIARRAS